MATIEKLRGISNWQTVVTVCFYLSAVLAITIVAVIYNIQWLIAGGATTLGIVAGSLTAGVGRAYSAVSGNPTNTNVNEELIKDNNDLRISIANLANEVLLLKNCIGELNGNE